MPSCLKKYIHLNGIITNNMFVGISYNTLKLIIINYISDIHVNTSSNQFNWTPPRWRERDGKSLAPYQIAFGANEAVIVSHKINRLGHGVNKHVILAAKP